MQAAAERVEVTKKQWLLVDGIFDANSRGFEGFEAGPGMRLTIPILNGNRGNIAIAEAQYQQAARRYETIRDQIRQDVLTARAQLEQATSNLRVVSDRLIPETQTASELAIKNFEGGGAAYFLTLQIIGQNVTAKEQRAMLMGEARRALAELERSVGHRIDLPFAEESEPVDLPPSPGSALRVLPPCRPVSHR